MIQTIDISLIPSDNKPVINVSQFDNISRVLRFNVFDDSDMETPHVFDAGDTVLLNIRKNDNNIVVITGVIVSDIDPDTQEITEQYLTFELTKQACACVGSNFGELSITSGFNEVIGSCNFKLIVERSPLAGGVSSQTAIDNLTTQIEEITEEVIGDNYYDKEEIDGKFDELDIPTKTSQLTNDSGFITAADIPTIPTKTSQLTNDSGFITASDIPTIPTKTSQLTNDSGFITASDIPTIPTKTSQLTNDSGFTTIDDAATADDKTWSSNKINNEFINLLPIATAAGNPANFITSFVLPLISAAYDFVATGGGGTPTTPVPIVGVSSVNVEQADENMQIVDTQLINLGDTYYGGVVEVDKEGHRRLKITKGVIILDGTQDINIGAQLYIKSDACDCFIFNNNIYPKIGPLYQPVNFALCDKLTPVKVSIWNIIGYPNCLTFNNNQMHINIANDLLGITDYTQETPTTAKAKIKTFLENNPITIVYGIEPTYIDIADGDVITTIAGVNNISCDTGDTTVKYKCRIEEYVNSVLGNNRSLSMLRSSETIEPIERGDNNDDNAR